MKEDGQIPVQMIARYYKQHPWPVGHTGQYCGNYVCVAFSMT